MYKNDIWIEPPPKAGEEIDFFLQETPKAHTSACVPHIHNSVELLYINEGSYNVIIDGAEHRMEQGDLVLFCSNTIHRTFTGEFPRNSYYVIKMSPSFFLNFSKVDVGSEYIVRFALNRKEDKNIWRRNELDGSRMHGILCSLIEEYNTQGYAAEVAIKLKITELLLTILREDAHRPEIHNGHTAALIYRVMLYVREHYAEDIDEKQLSKNMGISYGHFIRSFKLITGMTFKKYLNQTRINQAEQLLCSNDGSVSEIAAQCGYNSVSYFISVYRSIMGRTPYKTRQQCCAG